MCASTPIILCAWLPTIAMRFAILQALLHAMATLFTNHEDRLPT